MCHHRAGGGVLLHRRRRRQRPGVLSYSSAGTGTSTHMAAEFFKQMAGVDILHVPYRGSPQAVTDMLGGQVDMTFNTINSVMTAVRDGAAAGRAGLALPRSNPNMSGVILYGNQQFVVSDSSPAPGSIAAAVAAANRAASDATAPPRRRPTGSGARHSPRRRRTHPLRRQPHADFSSAEPVPSRAALTGGVTQCETLLGKCGK